jgi:hypothetical protein
MQAGPGNFSAAWTDDEVEHLSAMYWSDPRPTKEFKAAELGRTPSSIQTALAKFSISCAQQVTSKAGKIRPCITCERAFFSEGNGNRMCRRCVSGKNEREWDVDGARYRRRARTEEKVS